MTRSLDDIAEGDSGIGLSRPTEKAKERGIGPKAEERVVTGKIRLRVRVLGEGCLPNTEAGATVVDDDGGRRREVPVV